MKKKEQWKEVAGFEGMYQVSNYGRVKSLSRMISITLPSGTMYSRRIKGRILKPKKDKDGYLQVSLTKEYTKKVHRLLATAFCDGYSEGKQVNHIDENRTNNNAENLEWCTAEYNNRYGYHSKRSGTKHRRGVVQYSLKDEYINTFDSLKIAETSLNIKGASTPICRCCKGKIRQAYGYKWRYTI